MPYPTLTLLDTVRRMQLLGLYSAAGSDGTQAYWMARQQARDLGLDPWGVVDVDASNFANYWYALYTLTHGSN